MRREYKLSNGVVVRVSDGGWLHLAFPNQPGDIQITTDRRDTAALAALIQIELAASEPRRG